MSDTETEDIFSEKFYDQPLDIWGCEDILPLDPFTAASLGDVAYLKQLGRAISSFKHEKNFGWTTLMYAGFYGRIETIKLLLEFGESTSSRNKDGSTVLILVASCGHNDIIKELIKAGCNLNERDKKGWTALYHAVNSGQESTVRLLIENGANMNLCTNEGKSPLMCAAEFGNNAIVTTLLRSGAEPNVRNKDGNTALWYAQQENHQHVIYMLTSCINKDNENIPNLLRPYDYFKQKNFSSNSSNNPHISDNVEITPTDLPSLLEYLDLSSYMNIFKQQEIDLEIFLQMTDEDFKEIGIDKMGPRRKMTSTIARWHSNVSIKGGLEGAYADKLNNELQQKIKLLNQLKEDYNRRKIKASQEKDLRLKQEGWVVGARQYLNRCHQLLVELQSHMDHFRSLQPSCYGVGQPNMSNIIIEVVTNCLSKFPSLNDHELLNLNSIVDKR